jgi:uncharacterized membrane protein HdeD (DUF308 family)
MFGNTQRNWGWFLALGVLFPVPGVTGPGMSMLLRVADVLYFSLLLLIGGGFQLVQSFQRKGSQSVAWHVVTALVYLVAGAPAIYGPLGDGMGHVVAIEFIVND